MLRTLLLVLLAFAAGCDNGKAKAKEAVNKVDKVIDEDDANEAKQHLTNAKEAIGKGMEPSEDCSWAARAQDKDTTKASIDELKRICSVEVPLAKATKAVVAAEKAKAEQPEAPSFTECSSDDWATSKRAIEGGPNAGDAKWTDLKARWAKVCPDAK
jgi:hypothetical protein